MRMAVILFPFSCLQKGSFGIYRIYCYKQTFLGQTYLVLPGNDICGLEACLGAFLIQVCAIRKGNRPANRTASNSSQF